MSFDPKRRADARYVVRKGFVREALKFKPVGESMCKQAHQKECDINVILNKYAKTGLMLPNIPASGPYLDVTEVTDYHTAMNFVVEAQQAFDLLPASIRKRFNNDPGDFLDFVDDPENLPELREMGLAAPERPAGTPGGDAGLDAGEAGDTASADPAEG